MKKTIRWLALLSAVLMCMTATGCNLILEETVTSRYMDSDTPGTPSQGDISTDGTTADGDITVVTDNAGNVKPDKSNAGGKADAVKRTTVTTAKPADTARQEPKLSGKLELQIFTNESQTADGGWTKVINAFEDATGIAVTAHIGSSVNTMMSARWRKDNPPDFIWLDGSGIPDVQYEAAGKFADLSELYQNGYVYGTETKIKNVIDKNMLRYHGNALTRMPLLNIAGGLWYDAKFLESKGLSVPQNYTELLETAKKAKTLGLSTYTYPGLYPSYCMSNFIIPAIAAYGQSYLDAWLSGSKAAMQDARFKKVLENYTAFCRTGGYLMTGSTTMDHTSTQQKWINHQTLFIANGLWLPDETRKLWAAKNFDMTWTTSPLIESNQKPTAVLNSKYIAVPTKAKNKENALAFVRFLMREDSQKTLMYSFGYMGVRTDMKFDTAQFIRESGGSDAAKATAKALDRIMSSGVQRVYWHESWGSLGETIATEINELSVTNGKSVDQVIAAIAAAAPKP